MRDTVAERWVDKLAVKWEYERAYDLDRVDLSDDVTSQIRIHGTNEDHVDDFRRIAEAGENKDVPAIIVHRNGGPKDEIVDGIHRTRGFKSGGVAFHDAYVIKKADPMVLEAMRRTANVHLNGWGQDLHERLEHAWYMKRRHPERSNEEIAALMNVNTSTLGNYIRRAETRTDLQERGVSPKTLNALNASHLDAIAGQRPVVQEVMATCITDGKLSTKDARDLVRQVNAAESEADALGLIEETRKQYAARNQRRSGPARSLTTEWKRAISTVRTTMDTVRKTHATMTELQRREVADSSIDLSVELSDLAGEMVQ